jgi:outer membrane protein assembly factor BamD (BamD/ComL family)
MLARRSMEAGTCRLAQSDLQKVYNKYGSTAAGVQAAMLLAQIDYDQGKYQDGVNVPQGRVRQERRGSR